MKFWLQMKKGGNSKRKINVSSILPKYAFEKYIYCKNGSTYGNKIVKFEGNSVIKTNGNNSHCLYKFAAWFFNNSTSLQSRIERKDAAKGASQQELVNVYNCNFSYSTTQIQ